MKSCNRLPTYFEGKAPFIWPCTQHSDEKHGTHAVTIPLWTENTMSLVISVSVLQSRIVTQYRNVLLEVFSRTLQILSSVLATQRTRPWQSIRRQPPLR